MSRVVSEALQPLSSVPAGSHAIVHSLQGGRAFRSRAATLGFTVGAPITVLQNYGHGPMIVSVRGVRVALGRAEADKVLVRPLDGTGKL